MPRYSRGSAAFAGDAAVVAIPNGAANGAADDAAANDPAADNSAAAVSGVSVGANRGPIASKSLTKSSIAIEVRSSIATVLVHKITVFVNLEKVCDTNDVFRLNDRLRLSPKEPRPCVSTANHSLR